MPSYLSLDYIRIIWPPFAFSLAIGTGAFLITALRNSRSEGVAVGMAIFSYALLGFLIGIMAGHSRQPAVGTVVPAVLTLIAAVGLYASAQSSLGRAVFVAGGMSTLVSTLFVGLLWGAQLRLEFEVYTASLPYRIQRALDDAAIQITVEQELNASRQRLGLPPPATTPKP